MHNLTTKAIMSNKSSYLETIGKLSITALSTTDVSKILIHSQHPLTKVGLLYAINELLQSGDLVLTGEKLRTLLTNCRMRKIRTLSGVTTVTVLTAPYYCPGKCIFCPSDKKMPKSYLPKEPGAQRALANGFDPYAQVFNRLVALHSIGHPTDKVELIILGGSWTAYPKAYQIWFSTRCFEALNSYIPGSQPVTFIKSFSRSKLKRNYAHTNCKKFWQKLTNLQRNNESSKSRCVGLSLETRPDEITKDSIIDMRRLGATKLQLGVQSMTDAVLELNCRGHSVNQTQVALSLLRSAGFKLQIHWMANLLGSTPAADTQDYKRLFRDRHVKPDELKIYPCSLIKNTPLYTYYLSGKWAPYTLSELTEIVSSCVVATPRWCRLSRIFRDIPAGYIQCGAKQSNFRQIVDKLLIENKTRIVEIRHREIKEKVLDGNKLKLKVTHYTTSIGTEHFIEYVTDKDLLVGFCRLLLPKDASFISELGRDAVIREVHVYGQSLALSDKQSDAAQHAGVGSKLVAKACDIARRARYKDIAVISAVGTRDYYRKLGFAMGDLYMTKKL